MNEGHDPYGEWPPDTRYNNKWYHRLQNEFPTFQDRYWKEIDFIFTEGRRQDLPACLEFLANKYGRDFVTKKLSDLLLDAYTCMALAKR
jgi:hypothetical protein